MQPLTFIFLNVLRHTILLKCYKIQIDIYKYEILNNSWKEIVSIIILIFFYYFFRPGLGPIQHAVGCVEGVLL